MGFESGQTTNRGARGGADVSHGVTVVVLVVGFAYLSGGENGAEPEKTILGIVELGLGIIARAHHAHELAALDFRAQVDHVPLEVLAKLLLVELDDADVFSVAMRGVEPLMGGAQMMYPMTRSFSFVHCFFILT